MIWRVLGNILCDLDPKVKVKKADICDGVPSTDTLVCFDFRFNLILQVTIEFRKASYATYISK